VVSLDWLLGLEFPQCLIFFWQATYTHLPERLLSLAHRSVSLGDHVVENVHMFVMAINKLAMPTWSNLFLTTQTSATFMILTADFDYMASFRC
jgi:hypothetical protein